METKKTTKSKKVTNPLNRYKKEYLSKKTDRGRNNVTKRLNANLSLDDAEKFYYWTCEVNGTVPGIWVGRYPDNE